MPHPDGLHRDQRDVLLDRDRLHLRRDVAAVRRDHRAFELRRLRRVDVQRNAVLLHRHDAAWMQHLRAAARDLLRLVVFERAQQPCRRHRARIGAEHARHVGPDFQPTRLQLRSEVAARGIGAAAAEQHGVAVLVARDEALRDPHGARRRPALLQLEIGLVGARRRQIGRAHVRVAPLLGLEHGARIDPLHIESLRGEERGAEARRHQLALRHHARAQAFAHLADERDAGGDLSQALELFFEIRAGDDAEIAREVAMALLDLIHDRLPLAAEREPEQLLETIGDARQG